MGDFFALFLCNLDKINDIMYNIREIIKGVKENDMKKAFLILFVILMMILCLSACGNKDYTVTFDVSGGEMYTTELQVTYNEYYALPTPQRLGYQFLGWYYGDQLVPQKGIWIGKNDAQLVAKWDFAEFEITYDLDGGSHSSENVIYGYNSESEEFIIYPPVKEGQIFSHWVDQNGKIYYGGIKFSKGSQGDKHLKAVWWNFIDLYGVKYEYVNDELHVVDYVGDAKNDIFIYETLYGKKVTAIKESAFVSLGEKVKDYQYIFRMYIPKTVQVIEKNAFAGCDNLKVFLIHKIETDYLKTANEWASTAKIENEGNENLLDVILLKKACLGSSDYVDMVD